MAIKDFNKKISALLEEDSSGWRIETDWYLANRDWIVHSARIAARVLLSLQERNMTQADLAAALGVSPQQVSKILKGKENLTLETIFKIERVLGITLLHVPSETEDVSAYTKPLTAESGPKEILRFDVVYSAFQQAQERVSLVGEPEPNYVSSGKPLTNVA